MVIKHWLITIVYLDIIRSMCKSENNNSVVYILLSSIQDPLNVQLFYGLYFIHHQIYLINNQLSMIHHQIFN